MYFEIEEMDVFGYLLKTLRKGLQFSFFVELKFTSHSLAVSVIFFSLHFKVFSMTFMLLELTASELSSANKRVTLERESAMVFTFIKKSKGPNTEPCGTPALIGLSCENSLPTKTFLLSIIQITT